MSKESLVGMGADIIVKERLAELGHDLNKQKNHRQRDRYARLVRHVLNKERIRGQLGRAYMRAHRN